MRDAPDNSYLPLSRRSCERLLNTYERRDEDTSDNSEERSLEGMMKARWYPPEIKADWSADDITQKNTNDRPAKLMPYDYYYSVQKPGDIDTAPASEIGDDDTAVDSNKKDWVGAANGFFKEDEETDDEGASYDDVEGIFHHSISHAVPVELHLADGNFVSLTPHDATHIMKSNGLTGVVHNMHSIEAFGEFVKSVFRKNDKPPAGHEEHN